MPGPSGFTQRFTGKIRVGQIWMGRQQQNGAGSIGAYSTAGVTGQSIDSDRLKVATINSSSALSIWALSGPPRTGHELNVVITNSSGSFLKAAAGSFFDSTILAVIKSTQALQKIRLVGQSTVLWSITNVYPETTVGGAQPGGVTLSLTT